MIRSRTNRLGTREAFLYAFDPLELHGHDLRDESCHVRQAALNKLRARPRPGAGKPSDPARKKHLGHVIAKVGA
jgi:ATP-dependent DNA ligase